MDSVQSGSRERNWVILIGVCVAALAVRLLYLWQIRDAPFFDLRIGDAEAYHEWAKRIAEGDWLGKGVFYQAPLYPYFLAIVYRLFDASLLTVRVVQACLGAASCVLLAAAGVSLFGRRGAIAGVMLAFYPPAIFLDGLAEKSSLATFLITALLAAVVARRWLLSGIILGLLGLTRENALILAIACGAGPWTAAGPWPAKAKRTLTLLLGCALILLPSALRNLAVGGEFHLTTAQFGPNFYIGNHAGAQGTYEGLVEGHGSALDEREDATRLAEKATGRKLTPGEVSAYWTSRAFDFIRAEPLAWLKLIARKFALTFNAAEIADTESALVYEEWSWLLRILRPFDFGILLAMAALGVALTGRRLWLLYAMAGAYAISVALFYVFGRYRFPLVPILILIATGGLLEAWDRLRSREYQAPALAGAAALVALLFAHIPLDNAGAARATNYLGIAVAMSKDSQRANDAIRYYQLALDAAPEFPAARMGVGLSLARQRRYQEAIPYLQAALKSWPNYAEAHYNFGVALSGTGRPEEAAQEFTETLRLTPDDADAHFALGRTLVQLDRPKEAIPHYERALEKDPNNATAHNDLGITLANEGRIAEAVPHFEHALALDPNQSNARANLEQARRILASQTRR